ncbi:MAG TPA: anthranilate phosphoribosyltransferase [Steroidobacteraceae bacterium]|jgi:anthranilate phosphoribosyltransferase|nr:anthranilate phosphoribosyltransferase [Steroidobacteraceae bacterium]
MTDAQAAYAVPGSAQRFDTDAALSALLEGLLERRDLSEGEAVEMLTALTRPQVSPAMAAALLVALRAKGVTAPELRGFARGLRAQARRPALVSTAGAVDIVGTGGDRSGSFNLSTGAALLAAACGVPIIKHGNRSVSSRAGSADVLQTLGLPMPLDEAAAGHCFAALNFTFLFAPFYHSATRHIGPVRAALGVRTVFNVLGPLSNPAAPPFLVVGAYRLDVAELMAQALAGSGVERAFVIHGAEGWDEPTPVGPFTLFDVTAAGVRQEQRTPGDYGLACCDAAELAGGDAEHNARELARVLRGESRGAHRDALLLGAALALEVSGRESTMRAGVLRAAQAIDSGAAAALLERLQQFGRAHTQLAEASALRAP